MGLNLSIIFSSIIIYVGLSLIANEINKKK